MHAPYVVPSRDVRYGGNFSPEVPVTFEDLREIRADNRSWVDARNALNLSSRESSHVQQLEDRYDNSFIYMDRELGRLFDAMKAEGIYDDALIIVMSDHGEEFMEHGRIGHIQFYSETIRVPLAVKLPHQEEGRHVGRRAELRDIYPTVLKAASIGYNGTALPLQNIIRGARHDTIFAERLEKKMVVKDQHKLIWNFGNPGPTYKLYNLEQDPGEQTDLSANSALVRRINASFQQYPERTARRCDPVYDKSFLGY